MRARGLVILPSQPTSVSRQQIARPRTRGRKRQPATGVPHISTPAELHTPSPKESTFKGADACSIPQYLAFVQFVTRESVECVSEDVVDLFDTVKLGDIIDVVQESE